MTDERIGRDFRGVIYVEQSGREIIRQVTGFADLANRRENTFETRFASASAGKVFVAAGILRLIDQGKLRFSDTLGELLDLAWGRIDPLVTVRELLTHTSGVPDYFDESVMSDYGELWRDFPNYRIRQNRDLFPLFLGKPMMYPRGARFQYNNSGYVLLAAIIEQVSGLPFDVHLQREIFAPCGMERCGYFELDRLPDGCANHYIRCGGDGWRTNIFSVDAKGTGAGGAFVTAGDTVKFWNGLLGGKLFSAELTAEMMHRQSGDGEDPEEGYYGYGMWILPRPEGRDCACFQGCDPGVSFLSEYNPANGMISVLMSNYGDNVWREMRNIRENYY